VDFKVYFAEFEMTWLFLLSLTVADPKFNSWSPLVMEKWLKPRLLSHMEILLLSDSSNIFNEKYLA
jgi:hypothetical protein